jgi:hypothetical protein
LNYKANCLEELKQFSRENDSYSFGDVLFSLIQKIAVENKTSVSFLREVTDEDYFTLIEKIRIKKAQNED